jgi:hypothetical protein
MRNVYSQAQCVCIWLDFNIDPAGDTFRALCTLNSETTEKSFLQYTNLREDFWSPALEFTRLPYWRRVWIQQEIHLAKELTLQARKSIVPTSCIYHFSRLTSELALSLRPMRKLSYFL